VADHPGQDRFGDVDHLAGFASADRTEAYQVSVEVAATGTLDGLRDVVIADQQGLYFAHFKGTKNAAQAGNAAAVAAGLAEGFANRFGRAALLPVGENAFGLSVDFIAADVGHLGGKTAQQFCAASGCSCGANCDQ